MERNKMEKIRNAFFSADCPVREAGDGVTRQVLSHCDNLMICRMHFRKGAVGALHSHVHEQMSYVISGRFEFTIGDEKYTVGAGDTLYKHSGITHGCVCLEEGELIDVFTPQREDFLG